VLEFGGGSAQAYALLGALGHGAQAAGQVGGRGDGRPWQGHFTAAQPPGWAILPPGAEQALCWPPRRWPALRPGRVRVRVRVRVSLTLTLVSVSSLRA